MTDYKKIWTCKIGEVPSIPAGADAPMRDAIATAYRAITGTEPDFIFSGWGGELEECERAVVENRLPDPSLSPSLDTERALRIKAEAQLEQANARVVALREFAEAFACDLWSWDELIDLARATLAADDARKDKADPAALKTKEQDNG